MRTIKPAYLGVFLALSLALTTPASAQVEPDHDVPVLPPLDESTPDAVTVPETCDPLELVLCVGPVSEDVPVVVAVSSNGVHLLLWLHEGESEAAGPVQESIILPVTGTEVPITICPNTCPIPVLPEGALVGHAEVCYMLDGNMTCHVLDVLDGGSDADGDGVKTPMDPDDSNPYMPYLWRTPCSETDTSKPVYMCKRDDDKYLIQFPGGVKIISGDIPV